MRGDVTDLDSLRRGMAGCDRAIHAAAHVRTWDRERGRFETINVGGLVNVLRAAREAGLSRILYTSSFIALGPTDGQIADEDWAPPNRSFHNLYEKTKAEADAVARREAQMGAPIVILYPGVIYGPGPFTAGNLVGKTIRDFVARRIPGILGKGDRRFCYAYLSDVVKGHIQALRKAEAGERFILGGETGLFWNLPGSWRVSPGSPPLAGTSPTHWQSWRGGGSAGERLSPAWSRR